MIKLKVDFNAKKMMLQLKSQETAVKNLPMDAYFFFEKITPRDTGNAKRNTRLVGNTIRADYPYARRLDREGWSKQAPRGMSVPTLEYLVKRLKAIMKYRR